MTRKSSPDAPPALPETGSYASPPCYAHELDPLYAGDDPQQALDVARWRKAERERLRAARLEVSAEARAELAEALCRHLDAFLAARFGRFEGRVLSAYWPIKAELDLRPWLAELDARGVRVVLPVVVERAAPLVFRRWRPGTRMERGHWNIPVPPEDAERLAPEIALAPVVGWDAEGYRLGYGGGYFDRTLAALSPRPLAVGVGARAARIATIYPQPHDVKMAAIVTEAGVETGEGAA